MFKIRLMPTGKSVQRSFRIVATDARTKINGKYSDKIGIYNPNSKETKLNETLVLELLMNGAQPTATVRTLLSKQGILAKFHQQKLELKKAKLANKPKVIKAPKPKIEV